MSELSEAINEMRTMREVYDQLAGGVISAPVVAELEEGKAAIITAINAMGGTATVSMSLGELAQAIRALILVQLGDLEYNIPIENVEEAINLASTHCTKYVNDYTTQMYTPLIVDEWQAVEEVRYKKLLDYNFNQFSSDERKMGVYALTNCHSLKRLIFDSLRTITLPDGTSQFAGGNLVQLEEVIMPALTSIDSKSGSSSNSSQILSGLSSLTSLSLPALTSIDSGTGANNTNNSSQILSSLSSLTSISLPAITRIRSGIYYNGTDNSQILSGLSALTSLSLPAITEIRSTGNGTNKSQILSGCVNLEYIEIGHIDANGYGSITENMRCNINPTNTYNDPEKLAALNASIREHWFANLRDYTGGTAHTLTLMSAFVAHLEPETIQVATDKNWTIVTF